MELYMSKNIYTNRLLLHTMTDESHRCISAEKAIKSKDLILVNPFTFT